MEKRIYVASSWRNTFQPEAVRALREHGFDVYDFRNPRPGNNGFQWRQVDIGKPWNPEDVSAETYEKVLENPVAQHGLALDMAALIQAEATLLVLPCGNSAHLELGYAIGAQQLTAIWAPQNFRADLMLGMARYMSSSLPRVIQYFRRELEHGR